MNGPRDARAGDRDDHRARRAGAGTGRPVRRPDRASRRSAPAERRGGSSGELSSAAMPRRAASACSTSTVSATAMSSRYSSRVSNESRTLSTATCNRRRPAAAMQRQRVADVVREIVASPRMASACRPRLGVAAEDEQRERGRVRPIGDSASVAPSSIVQRAASSAAGPVVRRDERLHRADRPPQLPPGRRQALAVALRRPVDQSDASSPATVHQQGETRAARRIAHPRQLPLPGVRVAASGNAPSPSR